MQGKLTRDDNAGAVGSAALSVASLFFIAIMIIAFTANPIAIGTDVGERAPDVEGKAYNGTSWVEFDFESYLRGNPVKVATLTIDKTKKDAKYIVTFI